MQRVPIYYINLASRPDRRASIEGEINRLELEAIRVEAKVPADLSAEQLSRYCDPRAARSMTPRQYACNLSHAAAWSAFLSSSADKAMFLEDDAILSATLPRFLAALGEADDVVRLETWPFITYPFDGEIEPIFPDELILRACLRRDAGAAGYILSRRAALALLASKDFHTTLVDGLIFDPHGIGRLLRVRYVDPGLCIQACHLTPASSVAVSNINVDEQVFDAGRRQRSLAARIQKQTAGWFGYDIPRLKAYIVRKLRRRTVVWRAIPFRPD